MKKLSTIIMALALVLGMSQCKKQETPTNGNSGEMVHITLNVNDSESLAVNVNDNGSRHEVAPNLGVIQFTNGDKLYVGNNGHYVGYLQYVVDNNGRRFDGYIDGNKCSPDDQLHFYFLGGREPATAPTAGTTTDFTISIADQKQNQNLPVLCYGKSNENYSTNGSYTASLAYKCALVKFNLSNPTEYNCTLSDMPTEATISFATTSNNFTPIAKTSTTGNIKLYGEEGNWGVRWAILLPGTNLSADNHVDGEPSAELYENQFINSGITLQNPIAIPNPELVVKNGNTGSYTEFSVGGGKKVYFSRANLKCTPASGSTPAIWEFHENQVDECKTYRVYDGEYVMQSNTTNAAIPYDGAWVHNHLTQMDRFSWGLNDYTTLSEGGELVDADYVRGGKDLSVARETDWGCALTGAGNDHWRTLKASEWTYLLNSRGNKSFMMITCLIPDPVDSSSGLFDRCRGLLLFPDGFDESTLGLSAAFPVAGYNQVSGDYVFRQIDYLRDSNQNWLVYTNPNSNMYKLLKAGCVFLPAVGCRVGNNGSAYYKYNYYEASSGNTIKPQGYYWSATSDSNGTVSQYLWFGLNGGTYQKTDTQTATATETVGVTSTVSNVDYSDRAVGMCVRLVWDAN
jgi:hypothetical protein